MRSLRPSEIIGPLNDLEARFAPSNLFLEGESALLHRGSSISIVGSRRASPDGLARARKLAKILVGHGVHVLSGLAAGIDTAAHSAAIAAGGRTIGVLGTGLDVVYPAGNAQLQDQIGREHLLVSQFPAGTGPRRHQFPIRNRLMALLSAGTVIIEGAEGSGTLHQAWEALRLGREVFLPGSLVDRTDLLWPRKLLEHGAQELRGSQAEELLEYVDLVQSGGDSELLAAAM